MKKRHVWAVWVKGCQDGLTFDLPGGVLVGLTRVRIEARCKEMNAHWLSTHPGGKAPYEVIKLEER